MPQSHEDDDYMNMVFEDAPKDPKFETSLQRAARKRKEASPPFRIRARAQKADVCDRVKPERDRRQRLRRKQMPRQHEKKHSRLPYRRPTKASK